MAKLPRPLYPRRQPLRLTGYDYSLPGAYFVTICTFERRCLFGDVLDGEMIPTALGVLVRDCWQAISAHFPHVETDAFTVMPNHVHGLLRFREAGGRPLPLVIRALKAAVSQRGGMPVWQRGYYEHIVRSEDALNKIRRYIDDNPLNWADDSENPIHNLRT